jgi:hypothetical protein
MRDLILQAFAARRMARRGPGTWEQAATKVAILDGQLGGASPKRSQVLAHSSRTTWQGQGRDDKDRAGPPATNNRRGIEDLCRPSRFRAPPEGLWCLNGPLVF